MMSSSGNMRGAAGPMDEAELARLLDTYGPGLRRYFSRRANPTDADDLVQEVFLALGKRAADAPVENIEAYLFTVARHVLQRRWRKEKSSGAWLEEAGRAAREDMDELSPERALAAKQELMRAIVAILNLPPRTRAAFELHRFDMLSYSAIAERMGISKASVQDLMERAMARLSEEMDPDL